MQATFFIKCFIKRNIKDQNWQQEFDSANEQFQLLGIYFLLGLNLVIKPQSHSWSEESKILADALFFVTTVFGIMSSLSKKWKSV